MQICIRYIMKSKTQKQLFLLQTNFQFLKVSGFYSENQLGYPASDILGLYTLQEEPCDSIEEPHLVKGL